MLYANGCCSAAGIYNGQLCMPMGVVGSNGKCCMLMNAVQLQ